MSYQISPDQSQSFQVVRQGFLQADGLPFSEILSEEQIERAFVEEEALFGQEEDDVYTPALTLWAFLSQVIQAGAQRSCNAAVERLRTLCLALGLRAPSPDSGAYCRARAKLSESLLQRLTYEVADALEEQVPAEWLWYGHHVKVADGSTLMTPDTEANQAAWPQMTSQPPGLGFPILRFVMLFSLATAAVCGFAEAPYEGKETGEPALLRALFGRLQAGDVLLADACFCSYFLIALLIELGVDVVFHQHQRRKTDYTVGKRLGKEDHVTTWSKPARPDWMDQETYARMPEQITVRELTVHVTIPGFRCSEVALVTTLTNSKRYSKQALGDLYRQRWHAELDLRSLKVTMNLDDLRGTFPHMIRNEIWAHCLAYNLIRKTMATAAVIHECTPRTISFAGAVQSVAGVMGQASCADRSALSRWADQKLASIASHRIGKRPNRVEPRAIKRRPKSHKLLTKPRDEARAELGAAPASAV
jgi:putative transposase